MKVYIKVVVSKEYRGLILSLRSEFSRINLIDGKGYWKVKGINKKGNWIKRMVWKGPLFPLRICYTSISRIEEVDEKELEKINR